MDNFFKDELTLVFIVDYLFEEKTQAEEEFDFIWVDFHEALSYFLDFYVIFTYLSTPDLDSI